VRLVAYQRSIIKRFLLFVFLSVAFLTKVPAQVGTVQQRREKRNMEDLLAAGLKFNMPNGFHQLNTDTTGSLLMDSEGRMISPFRYVLANNDTSIAIGVYYTANHQLNNIKEFNTSASGQIKTYVDTLTDDFKRYDKTFLALKWHTNFGIEFSRPMDRPFMGRFLNNRIVYIANQKMEFKLVYFYKNTGPIAIADVIKRTRNILEPAEAGVTDK
jgi:hypothetical protein